MRFSVLLAKFINGNCKFLPEKFNTSQHSRIQKIHLGIYVESVVLQWRTTHAYPVGSIQKAGCFCYLTCRVFYCLEFGFLSVGFRSNRYNAYNPELKQRSATFVYKKEYQVLQSQNT